MPTTKTTSKKRSPVDRATDYAEQVAAGKIIAGPSVRAACSRHLADLKRPAKDRLVWSLDHAGRVYRFFENVLRLNGGEHEGAPFKLQPCQAFILGNLFGWRNADLSRRFQTAYIEMAKGNGKSPLAAGIGLYGLIADDEPRAEIYAAATKKEQAQILFRDAVAMVELSPLLSAQIAKSGGTPVWNLGHRKSGSWFRPISADDGQSGPRPHIALVDEVHEHKNALVIDMLRAGFKGRSNPMIVEITNSGVDRTTVCYQHHEYTKRVVTGQVKNDTWFGFITDLDEGDDPFEDESCWAKANPLLGVSVTLKYLRGQVGEAKGMPAKASIVRRLNFCQWVDAENPWIDGDIWRRAEIEPEYFEPPDVEPVGAIDLSGTKDLTALSLVWRDGDKFAGKVYFWTPADTLIERAKTDRVPYDVWVNEEHVIATPGRAVDFAYVAQALADIQQETGLRRVAFDAYKIKYLEKELDAIGCEIELVPHGQGFYKSAAYKDKDGNAKPGGLWMPHSIAETERLLSMGALTVCKNPALTFAAASAVTEMDAQENRRFTKRNSKGRIDGLVALVMAVGLALEGADKEAEPGIIVL
ncbi:MAG: terminase large subunit [Rhodocyclaceae bacterium]|nr:terminase large subunit [Rhodocyclaceae bacterium]